MPTFKQRLELAAAQAVPTGAGDKLLAQISATMAEDGSPIAIIRELGAISGIGWMWLVDGLGDDEAGPPGLEDDVRFRIIASLYGMKLGDRFDPIWVNPKEPLRLNTIERLALARVIQRNTGVSLVEGFEDSVQTLPALAAHVQLLAGGGGYDEFWCDKLTGTEI